MGHGRDGVGVGAGRVWRRRQVLACALAHLLPLVALARPLRAQERDSVSSLPPSVGDRATAPADRVRGMLADSVPASAAALAPAAAAGQNRVHALGERPAGLSRRGRLRARRYIFLRPELDYGSAVVRTPADAFLNRGLSTLIFDDQGRLDRIRWAAGWASVWDALEHPSAAVTRGGGADQVFHREFVPMGGRVWRWAWAPNYGGHIVGGGITYRYLTEWFEERNVPLPALAAGVVHVASMLANETLESQKGPPGTSATLVDLTVFDPAGMLLFSFPQPARFFANTLDAADWSPMASLALPGPQALNLSQVLSYRIPIPLISRLRVQLLLGQSANTGLSYAVGGGYRVAGVTGFETRRRGVDPRTGEESIVPAWSGGVYVDRENSLLLSLLLSQRVNNGLQLNVYPGVLPGRLRPAGVWVIRSRQGEWSTGLAFRRTLGVGFGAVLPQ